MTESASVTKAFGQPVDSGLPYIIIPMPDVVQKTVDDLALLFEAKDSPNPAHVTVFGPIIADREKALDVALDVCQAVFAVSDQARQGEDPAESDRQRGDGRGLWLGPDRA